MLSHATCMVNNTYIIAYRGLCRKEEKQLSKLPSRQESQFEGHLSFSSSPGFLVFSTEFRFLPEYKGRKRLQKGECELLGEEVIQYYKERQLTIFEYRVK